MSSDNSKSGVPQWYEEPSSTGVVHKFTMGKSYFKGQSDFQQVEVLDTAYGKMMILDDQVQSSAFDEFIYHESLVQPSMLSHITPPKRVFIGGGGEGATAREVLRHASVEYCVMVDIDPLACQAAKDHMEEWHKGAFDDPRMKLVVDDAKKILESYPDGYFDVIILDLSDPLDYGPCYKLYSKEFYTTCYNKMTQDGIFVTQSANAGLKVCSEVFTCVHRTLNTVFDTVIPYSTFVPSFLWTWGFNMAFKSKSNLKVEPGHEFENIKKIDALIKERLPNVELKHYDGLCHIAMTSSPKYLRKALDDDQRVITEETPIYVAHVKNEIK